jgi:hypothetical protein
MSPVQQFGQLASINAVALIPNFQQGIFPRIAHQYFCDVGLEQIVQPGRAGSSSNVTYTLPRSPWMNCRRVAAFVSTIDSINSLPAGSRTAAEIVAWCTSSPIYLASFIRVLLSVGVDANNQNLP